MKRPLALLTALLLAPLTALHAQDIIRPQEPITLRVGNHLFIDDYLIEQANELTRTMHQPVRLAEPHS